MFKFTKSLWFATLISLSALTLSNELHAEADPWSMFLSCIAPVYNIRNLSSKYHKMGDQFLIKQTMLKSKHVELREAAKNCRTGAVDIVPVLQGLNRIQQDAMDFFLEAIKAMDSQPWDELFASSCPIVGDVLTDTEEDIEQAINLVEQANEKLDEALMQANSELQNLDRICRQVSNAPPPLPTTGSMRSEEVTIVNPTLRPTRRELPLFPSL